MSTATTGPPNSSHPGPAKSRDVFPTRVDAWLTVLVGLAVAICFVQAWSLRSSSAQGALAAFAIGAFSLTMVLALAVPCRYTLETDHLSIRCGFIRKRIPYAQINRIEPSSSPLSAPALSLRRVKIGYGRSFQLVSPRERDRFMEELAKRAGLAG
jgi:membrane protein YdbS with pleckstrin-like domain